MPLEDAEHRTVEWEFKLYFSRDRFASFLVAFFPAFREMIKKATKIRTF